MTDDTAGGTPGPGELLRVWRETHEHGGVVVHLAGEVDLASAATFRAGLDGVADTADPVVVDLTGVTFLGSAGLSLLVEHDQRRREAGARLRVVAGNRAVSRAITMTGLDATLTVFDSVADAVT